MNPHKLKTLGVRFLAEAEEDINFGLLTNFDPYREYVRAVVSLTNYDQDPESTALRQAEAP